MIAANVLRVGCVHRHDEVAADRFECHADRSLQFVILDDGLHLIRAGLERHDPPLAGNEQLSVRACGERAGTLDLHLAGDAAIGDRQKADHVVSARTIPNCPPTASMSMGPTLTFVFGSICQSQATSPGTGGRGLLEVAAEVPPRPWTPR